MKNVNQEGLNELSQEEKNDITAGGLLKILDDFFESCGGPRVFKNFE
jgi:hypothetical protein